MIGMLLASETVKMILVAGASSAVTYAAMKYRSWKDEEKKRLDRSRGPFFSDLFPGNPISDSGKADKDRNPPLFAPEISRFAGEKAVPGSETAFSEPADAWSDLPENDECPEANGLADEIRQAFDQARQSATGDLRTFLDEREKDFVQSAESSDFAGTGLFLVDFLDEIRRTKRSAALETATALDVLSRKIEQSMSKAGFTLFRDDAWNRSRQRILSAVHNPGATEVRIVSTEETGLLYRGKLLRKQGVSIMTNVTETQETSHV